MTRKKGSDSIRMYILRIRRRVVRTMIDENVALLVTVTAEQPLHCRRRTEPSNFPVF